MLAALNPSKVPPNSQCAVPAVLDMSILHKSPGFSVKPWATQVADAAAYLKRQTPGRRVVFLSWLFGWAQDPRQRPWGEVALGDMVENGLIGRPQFATDYRAIGQLTQALRDAGVWQVAVTYANVEVGYSLQGIGLEDARERIADRSLRAKLPAMAGMVTPDALAGKYGWDQPGYFEANVLWNDSFNYGVLDDAIAKAMAPIAKLGPIVNSPGGYSGGDGRWATWDYNGWPNCRRKGQACPQLYLQAGDDPNKPDGWNGAGANARLGLSQDPRWTNFLLAANILRANPGASPVFAGPAYCRVDSWQLEQLLAVAAESGVRNAFAFNETSVDDTAALEAAYLRTIGVIPPTPTAELTPIRMDATQVVLRSRTITRTEYISHFNAGA